jgi:DNA polymerase-3 subunit beta
MYINRLDLLRCMQTIIKVIPQRGSIPTLSGVFLSAQNNLLTVRGTDLEVGMEAQSVCQGDLKIVLPAKMLLDIVSKLSNDTVEIIAQNGTAEIKCGRSHYTISAMDFENYPIFPEIEADPLSFPLAELKKAINLTLFSASNNETRGPLTGLCLDLTKKTLSATDGHRLSIAQNLRVAGEGQFILPFKTAKELSKINGGTYQVKAGEGQIEFTVESPQYVKLFSRLIEGEFPSSEGVVPEEFETIVFFNRENLLDSLSRINIIKPESVYFDLDRKLLRAESPENGFAQEEIEFWYEKEGKLKQFAFSPQFLIEPLSIMKNGQVFIKANGEVEPMILEERDNNSWMYLFMPLKVREEYEL